MFYLARRWSRRHSVALAIIDAVLSTVAGAVLPLVWALILSTLLTLAVLEVEGRIHVHRSQHGR